MAALPGPRLPTPAATLAHLTRRRRAVSLLAAATLTAASANAQTNGSPPSAGSVYGQGSATGGTTAAPSGAWSSGAAANGAPATASQGQATAAAYAEYTATGERTANRYELAGLYASTAAYGVALGVWIDAEFGIKEPGVVLIPPAILGVAAPVTMSVLNRPRMPRGMPAAITTGITVGGAEALSIVALQSSTANDRWGIKGVTRSLALGTTLGGTAGYFLGVTQRPSPNLSAFMSSGVFLGGVIGGMFGFGSTRAGETLKQSDGPLATGAMIGLNVGLATTAALGTQFVPSVSALRWMWAGAGIGAIVSLPAYLFYVGEDSPPAKRGLLFTGTTTALGAIAGGVLGPEMGGELTESVLGNTARITNFGPMPLRGGMGLMLGGELQ